MRKQICILSENSQYLKVYRFASAPFNLTSVLMKVLWVWNNRKLSNFVDSLISICQSYYDRVTRLENEKYDMEKEVEYKDYKVWQAILIFQKLNICIIKRYTPQPITHVHTALHFHSKSTCYLHVIVNCCMKVLTFNIFILQQCYAMVFFSIVNYY